MIFFFKNLIFGPSGQGGEEVPDFLVDLVIGGNRLGDFVPQQHSVAPPQTMNSHLGISMLPARLGGIALGVFGVLGLILAAVGIYGVMSYAVSQRTREIGIRVALGADRGQVTGMVLWQGARIVIIGVVVGLAGALGAAQLIRSQLYSQSGIDPVTFIGVPLILAAVALLATYLPARRAATVDPIQALKYE